MRNSPLQTPTRITPQSTAPPIPPPAVHMGLTTPTLPPLSDLLPPLVLGTATFNTQYVDNPTRMPYQSIISRALDLGITAFDTSPYYGPAEHLLGDTLHSLTLPNSANAFIPDSQTQIHDRESYIIMTKAGRLEGNSFDYSPEWIRYSVLRSLKRLHTPYLDLVYCHDVEFVSAAQVLAAVAELRRLRDQGLIRYVGISGYPIDVLCDLAETIYRETGTAVDAVMSYCHCTIQNHRLIEGFMDGDNNDDDYDDDEDDKDEILTTGSHSDSHCLPPLVRLKRAGVSAVLNASILGMGLLTSRGVDNGPQAAWHPSPLPLRNACADMAAAAMAGGEKLESLSIRWSLYTWARAGASCGLGVNLAGRRRHTSLGYSDTVGATVVGITSLAELDETWDVWMSVLAESVPAVSLHNVHNDASKEANQDEVVNGDGVPQAASLGRCNKVLKLVKEELWPLLGGWRNYSWPSGLQVKGFYNTRRPEDIGKVPMDDGIIAEYGVGKQHL